MKAILARTTTDKIKSKILSPHVSELVIEVYITPSEFAKLIEQYDEKEFVITIGEERTSGEPHTIDLSLIRHWGAGEGSAVSPYSNNIGTCTDISGRVILKPR